MKTEPVKVRRLGPLRRIVETGVLGTSLLIDAQLALGGSNLLSARRGVRTDRDGAGGAARPDSRFMQSLVAQQLSKKGSAFLHAGALDLGVMAGAHVVPQAIIAVKELTVAVGAG